MTALVALGIAVLALALSGAGVWALLAWRRYRRTFDIFADRLVHCVDHIACDDDITLDYPALVD